MSPGTSPGTHMFWPLRGDIFGHLALRLRPKWRDGTPSMRLLMTTKMVQRTPTSLLLVSPLHGSLRLEMAKQGVSLGGVFLIDGKMRHIYRATLHQQWLPHLDNQCFEYKYHLVHQLAVRYTCLFLERIAPFLQSFHQMFPIFMSRPYELTTNHTQQSQSNRTTPPVTVLLHLMLCKIKSYCWYKCRQGFVQ
jgi:hypothetical protein